MPRCVLVWCFGYILHDQTGRWCPDPRFFTRKHGFSQFCCGHEAQFLWGRGSAEVSQAQQQTGWALPCCCWAVIFPVPTAVLLGVLHQSKSQWLQLSLEQTHLVHWGNALELSYPQLRDMDTGIISFFPALTTAHTLMAMAWTPGYISGALTLNRARLWFYIHPVSRFLAEVTSLCVLWHSELGIKYNWLKKNGRLLILW